VLAEVGSGAIHCSSFSPTGAGSLAGSIPPGIWAVVSGTTVPSAFCQVFLVPLVLQIKSLPVIESLAVPPATLPHSRLGAGTPSG
jgi:hypothetical protein